MKVGKSGVKNRVMILESSGNNFVELDRTSKLTVRCMSRPLIFVNSVRLVKVC